MHNPAILDLILGRRSIRRYLEQAVEPEAMVELRGSLYAVQPQQGAKSVG